MVTNRREVTRPGTDSSGGLQAVNRWGIHPSSGPAAVVRLVVIPRLSTAAAALILGAAAGLLPPRLGIAFAAGAVAGVVIVVQPVLGLAALTAAVPFGTSGDSESAVPITPTDLLVGLILLAALAGLLARRHRVVVLSRAFWPGVGFIAVSLLSASFATRFDVSLKEILRWIELLAILVITATWCREARQRYLVVGALLVSLTGEALLGWAQFFLRHGPPSFRIGPFLRAYGTFGQPNPFGGYLAMVLPVAIALAFWRRPWAGRPDRLTFLALLSAVTGGIALLMSLSRGAWMGILAGLALLLWTQTRRGGLVVLAGLLLSGALAGLAVTHLLPATILGRLAQVVEYVGLFDASRVVPTAANWAIVERMAHWQAAWNMYQAYPVLGVGPGHYALAYPTFRVNNFWLLPLGHAHNIYLNIMAETGFLGIISYLVQLASWIAVIIAARRRAATPRDRALATGILASSVAVAIHNGFDNLYVHGLNAQLGLLVGLAAAIEHAEARDERECA